ncbi:MAG: aldo/keto reductase [Solibacterales bacterium]|nr:aldo/keto reductase [Bryobacterales bacterium]
MRYSVLGKTGLRVSRLSFGTAALGGVFRVVDESEAIQAVHTALDKGINYFDVAPAYGGTKAEMVLGKSLKEIPRDSYFLSTKVGKYTDPHHYGVDVLDYSRSRIHSSLDESGQRLGVDYFDIIHLHDFEYQDRVCAEQALTEGVETLLELKRKGRIGAVSVGIYPLDLWRQVITTIPVDAILTHNHYCLNDTTLLDLLPLIQEENIGLINASPFASGLLTGADIADWHPVTEQDFQHFRRAAEFCEQQGVSIAKLALQFASQHPEIPTTMFSSARPEAVLRNIAWHEETYDTELAQQVQRILAPVRNKQWNYDAGVGRLKSAESG